MTTLLPELTAPRLVLRPLDLTDVEAVQRQFPRWEIVRYLTAYVPWPYPPDGALTFIRDVAIPAMQAGREWHWSIRRKTAPEQLIGVVSLMDRPNDNRGFWLDPAWQQQGLMAEASAAATDYWFEMLGRPVLRVAKAAANLPSRRISERSSMRLIATTERDYVCGRQPEELWEITREEWRLHRALATPAGQRNL
jgi:[ribosomal protein S5]-alanine N-acetyltransferase